MKQTQMKPPSPPPPMRASLLTSAVPAAAVFFLLGYLLGLLSALHHDPPTSHELMMNYHNYTISSAAPKSDELLRFRTKCSPPIPHSSLLHTILSRLYNGTSPYAGFPDNTTSDLLLPVPPRSRLRGWGSRNRVFADLIASVQPTTIIELGTFLGASALHMAGLTRDLGSLILCLDDFRGWPAFQSKFPRDVPRPRHADSLLLHQFMLAVVAAGETGRVIPVPFSTGSSLAALCEWGVYGDLIEVDAGHDFHSAWADVNMAYAVLRPGGVLFGHDYFTAADDRGVQRAVNLFARVKGLRVRANGEHWVLSPKPLPDHETN